MRIVWRWGGARTAQLPLRAASGCLQAWAQGGPCTRWLPLLLPTAGCPLAVAAPRAHLPARSSWQPRLHIPAIALLYRRIARGGCWGQASADEWPPLAAGPTGLLGRWRRDRKPLCRLRWALGGYQGGAGGYQRGTPQLGVYCRLPAAQPRGRQALRLALAALARLQAACGVGGGRCVRTRRPLRGWGG